MIELNVFTYDFERIGTIEHYNSLTIVRNYYERSVLELTLEASERNIELLKYNNILTTTSNVNYGYIIRHFAYTDENAETISIIAYSLNHLLNWRTIIKQDRKSGNVEQVLKWFVARHCISPSDSKRIIPRLINATDSGINATGEVTATGRNLEEFAWEFCQKYEMTFDVLMNHTTKQYEVYTWQGTDKSVGATLNAVQFSKEFENVAKLEFVHDESEHRTTAYIAGEGEGNARTVVTVNDNLSGLNRKEIFIDARDLQSTYNEDGEEITIPVSEYQQMLRERGLENLSEMKVIETFEGEIIDTQFKYGEDYSLGDIVSFKSERLNRILHTRVTSVLITVDGNKRKDLQVSFGNKIPTLLDKIKKAVRK